MKIEEGCGSLATAMRVSFAAALAWIIFYLIYKYYSYFFSFLPVPQVLGLLVGVALGAYTRSLVVGYSASSLFLFNPGSPREIPAYSGYVILLTLALMGLLSYKRGPSDSVVEALLWHRPVRATPVLAAASLLSIYYFLGFKFIYNSLYLVNAGLAAVIASRNSETLWKALSSSIVASLGPVGLLSLSLYLAYMPLPPLRCGGLALPGRLVAYEEETSSTRLLTGGRRWRDRGLACSKPSTPILNLGRRAVVWAYSTDPKGTALILSKSLASKGRALFLDLDSISPCKGPSGRVEAVCLGDYPLVEVKAYLSSLAETAKQYQIVAVSSCRVRPRDIARELALIASNTTVVASLCLPEEDALIASSGPEGGGTLFSMLGDPLLTRTVLGKMFDNNSEKIYYLFRKYRVYLFYPYCERRWAAATT
ncbi:MAG: hypothetical protein F7C33_06895 [Desulfurococcales archaeon]|nr:hypothetical protein [Desulfurococcales archaeon]